MFAIVIISNIMEVNNIKRNNLTHIVHSGYNNVYMLLIK